MPNFCKCSAFSRVIESLFGKSLKQIRNDRNGFSLVEVMFAIAVLSVAVLGVVGALSYGIVANEYAGTYSEANQLAREVVESVRAEQIAFEAPGTSIYTDTFDSTKKAIGSPPFDGSYVTLPDLSGQDRFSRRVTRTEVNPQLTRIEATVSWEQKGAEKEVTVVAFSRDYLGGTGTTTGNGSGGSGNGNGSGGTTSGTTTSGTTGNGNGNGNGNGSGGTTSGTTTSGTTTSGTTGNGNGNGNGNGSGGTTSGTTTSGTTTSGTTTAGTTTGNGNGNGTGNGNGNGTGKNK
jgi:prepilin-type N-terminal cleavage/methylation domain-containing protein